MSYTFIFLIITVGISLLAMSNAGLIQKLILWPFGMRKSVEEYYRFLTSGFIHADVWHLMFNMFTLYFIGKYVEMLYATTIGRWQFIALYVLGIIVANIPSFIKHRGHAQYRSLGASGGVAAVLFAMVYFGPWVILRVWFIPIPAILFAVLYIVYTIYMGKKGQDYINHDAHLWGSLFGFVFTLLMDPSHGGHFIRQLSNPSFL